MLVEADGAGGINNYVAGDSDTNFNFAAWDTFAKTQSYNPDAKVFLGVPASQSAAGTGYVDAATLGSAAQYLQSTYSSFGGIMMWYVFFQELSDMAKGLFPSLAERSQQWCKLRPAS